MVLAEGLFLVVLVVVVIWTPMDAFACILMGSWRGRPVYGFAVGRTVTC